ncbi:TPA: chromosome partitioning protein ParB, partial [Streptococcus pyogenes]
EELDEILNIDMSDFGFDILEDEKEVNQDTDYEEIDDKSVIIVEASSEKELEELYDEFVERGITCRVSIL